MKNLKDKLYLRTAWQTSDASWKKIYGHISRHARIGKLDLLNDKINIGITHNIQEEFDN